MHCLWTSPRFFGAKKRPEHCRRERSGGALKIAGMACNRATRPLWAAALAGYVSQSSSSSGMSFSPSAVMVALSPESRATLYRSGRRWVTSGLGGGVPGFS